MSRPGSPHAPIAQLLKALEVLRDGGISDVGRAVDLSLQAKACGNRFYFIGNGGSAAIASHMAADWLKNGEVAAQCFNDAASLTCLSNDLGYCHAFEVPVRMHARKGDMLFAISSSGESENILAAVRAAYERGCYVVTLSGFKPENRLRNMGDVNFYVPSSRYGTVEICHHAICHAVLDKVINAANR